MRTHRHYEQELKEKIIQLHLEEGRTKKSLTQEYQLGQGTLTYWLQQHREECRYNPTVKAYEENRRLRRKLAEQEKEIAFLRHSLRKKSIKYLSFY